MKITERLIGKVWVLTVTEEQPGESDAKSLTERLDAIVRDGGTKKVVIDFTDVNHLDSQLSVKLSRFHHHLLVANGGIRIVKDLRPLTAAAAWTQLFGIIQFHYTKEAAIASFTS